ncbi:MAG: mannose-phosphate guanylyltransferase [Myxococcaceae bacterium]|nr:mannose-phosphate guanylyltransferase [Myxococcaceae bacterium]
MPLKNAMLFAAGLGTRMRPLTEHTPKALIEVAGKTILDYALAHFEAAGCERIVVNTHHLAPQLAEHLARHRGPAEIVRIHEDVLLETGGAVVNALSLLGDEAFYCMNVDMIWRDDGLPALERLQRAYDPSTMDALLLLQPMTRTVSYGGKGDFGLNEHGELTRSADRPYAYASLQAIHPRLFRGRRVEPFSLRDLWFAGQRADGSLARMHGLVHEGDWLHIGTPAELAAADQFLRARL